MSDRFTDFYPAVSGYHTVLPLPRTVHAHGQSFGRSAFGHSGDARLDRELGADPRAPTDGAGGKAPPNLPAMDVDGLGPADSCGLSLGGAA